MSVFSDRRRIQRAIPLQPRLPRPASTPPTGHGWVHEIKHDGFRIMARRDRVRLFTRDGFDFTARYPKIAAAPAALGCVPPAQLRPRSAPADQAEHAARSARSIRVSVSWRAESFGGRDTCELYKSIDVRRWHREGRLRALRAQPEKKQPRAFNRKTKKTVSVGQAASSPA